MAENLRLNIDGAQRDEFDKETLGYELLSSRQFHADILSEMTRARERVWVQTMDFSHGQRVGEFVESLTEAAGRVDTRFRLDQYALTAIGDIPTSIGRHIPRLRESTRGQLAARMDLLHRLPDGVVKISTPTTLQRVVPYMGTDHKKMFIVDSIAYVGGINVSESGFQDNDFMIKTRNPQLVNALAMVFMGQDSYTHDVSFGCGENTEVIVDAGRHGGSLIMDSTRRIISEAQQTVQIISPFDPFFGLGESMEEAIANGSKVSVIAQKAQGAYIWKIASLASAHHRRKALLNSQVELLYPPSATHSKLCIVDNRIAIFGSHNFSMLGVNSGAKELSVVTQVPELVGLLSDYFNNLSADSAREVR